MTGQPDSTVPIIILAAGLSSRMRGRDKLLETVDGQPLLALQIARARAATSGPVLVTLPPTPHPRYDVVDMSAAEVVTVEKPQDGMSVSLRAGLAALPQDAVAAMIALPDLPEIETDDLVRVLTAVTEQPQAMIWRGATEAGRPGHPVVFSARLFEDLAKIKGDQGGAAVIKDHAPETVLVPLPGERALRDLDTPEAWAAWRIARPRLT